jgi:hypothetical protein
MERRKWQETSTPEAPVCRKGVKPVMETCVRQATNGCWVLCLCPYPSATGSKEPPAPAKELERWMRTMELQGQNLRTLYPKGMGLSWCGEWGRPGHFGDAEVAALVDAFLNARRRLPPLSQIWGHHNPNVGNVQALIRLVMEGTWVDEPELHLSNCGFGSTGLWGLLRSCCLAFSHFRVRLEGNPMLDLWLTMDASDWTLLPTTSWYTRRDEFWRWAGPPGPRVFVGSEQPKCERDILVWWRKRPPIINEGRWSDEVPYYDPALLPPDMA